MQVVLCVCDLLLHSLPTQWAVSELAALVQQEVQRQAATAVPAALQRELQAMRAGIHAVHQGMFRLCTLGYSLPPWWLLSWGP